jgi:alpha-mannosidase
VESGPLRAALEVERPIGDASRITQRYVLEAGSPRLDIQTWVEWAESRRLLRAIFPVDVRASYATCDVAFGHLQRPTHRNTPWDRAQFETCAHRWVDLSERGFGVAILNDCKYGHSCDGNRIGLTLLRSPKFPDAHMDVGPHAFVYSIMLHDGDWRRAGVDREAAALNEPLRAVPLAPGVEGRSRRRWAPFDIEYEGAARVSVSALKPAEDGNRLVVRLVETHGGRGEVTLRWHLPVDDVTGVDLRERPSDGVFSHDAVTGGTRIAFGPFQIVSLAVRRTDGE